MNKIFNMDFKTAYYSDKDRNKFYEALQSFMQQFGCYYLAYVCEDIDKKLRVGFASNPDWQDEYIGNHLIDDCHLWKTVVNQFILSKQTSLIFPWETIKPTTSKEKDIAAYREEFDIGSNGISFCTQHNSIREYLAFAPDANSKNFVRHVSHNLEAIKKTYRNI